MHVFAVVVLVEQDGGEAVAAQVASTCSVADELNLTEVEFNYLPMDVVCNGTASLGCIRSGASRAARATGARDL